MQGASSAVAHFSPNQAASLVLRASAVARPAVPVNGVWWRAMTALPPGAGNSVCTLVAGAAGTAFPAATGG
jgi:hypothetical protein